MSYENKQPWPKNVGTQSGDKGVVIRSKEKGGPYSTAFFEAFFKDNFIRGEGETVEDAEKSAFEKYNKMQSCEHNMKPKKNREDDGVCSHCQFRVPLFFFNPVFREDGEVAFLSSYVESEDIDFKKFFSVMMGESNKKDEGGNKELVTLDEYYSQVLSVYNKNRDAIKEVKTVNSLVNLPEDDPESEKIKEGCSVIGYKDALEAKQFLEYNYNFLKDLISTKEKEKIKKVKRIIDNSLYETYIRNSIIVFAEIMDEAYKSKKGVFFDSGKIAESILIYEDIVLYELIHKKIREYTENNPPADYSFGSKDIVDSGLVEKAYAIIRKYTGFIDSL